MFQPGSQKEKVWHRTLSQAKPCPPHKKTASTVYCPRNHESPFFKIVRDHFDQFEQIYPERFRKNMVTGANNPKIRSSIDKFLKCGDLKEGFARVRCPDCHEEFFVAFPCRQRSCSPTCDQKRALLLGHRLKDEVFADVPHRQWFFTIQSDYEFISGLTEVFWRSSAVLLTIQFVKFIFWKLMGTWVFRL